MRKRKFAVFDIDGTVFRSSLLIELVRALILEKIFPPKIEKEYASAYLKWLERKGSYENYLEKVIKVFYKNIKGVKFDKFIEIANKVVSFHKNRVYRYTRDLIKKLKKRKYYLIAISHSPKILVEKFASSWGFDKVYGQFLEVDKNQRLTGKVLYLELIKNKDKILKKVIEKEKLTLKKSIGVGDTENDIPFLKMVEKPICFNPNKKLYQYAKRKKWLIVVERKDVIFLIK
jgi:HAD superfamily hydrolase (TIGR01490 family)